MTQTGFNADARERALSPRVLFVVAEMAPWVKTGGLADVGAALPAALRATGVDVRILLPAYPAVRKAMGASRVVAEIPQPGADFPSALLLAGTTPAGVPVYALDCLPLFARGGDPYVDAGGRDWPDNHLRFGLVSKVAALMAQGLPGLDWIPQILHCNDWHTGLAPAYLHFAEVSNVKSMLTIHNIAFQGNFPRGTLGELGLPERAFSIDGVEFHGQVSFLKAGLQFADALTTVSPSHAREILSDNLAFGFGGLLRQREQSITGILNGIDTTLWNPATDMHLARRYDSSNLDGKAANKAALQRRLKLPVAANTPLFGVVSRLTHQKGLDLLPAIADGIAALPAQLVVLGTGDKALEQQHAEMARARPDAFAAVIGFDESLAHLIEAGADMFVMPSRYEPCGLNQMFSLRYGTPPVVHATGGLADTVIDCNDATLAAGTATGFVLSEPTAPALLAALERAVSVWREPVRWRQLQQNGMHVDFGWEASAQRYKEIYGKLLRG